MVTAPMAAREEKPTHLRRTIRQPRLTGLNVSIGQSKNRTPVEDFLKKPLQCLTKAIKPMLREAFQRTHPCSSSFSRALSRFRKAFRS